MMSDKPAVPESTLLPCPFCGGEGVLHKGDEVFWMECHTCDLDMTYQTTREAAINAWNTRPAASPVAGVSGFEQVERLRWEEVIDTCSHKDTFVRADDYDKLLALYRAQSEGDGWIAVTPEKELLTAPEVLDEVDEYCRTKGNPALAPAMRKHYERTGTMAGAVLQSLNIKPVTMYKRLPSPPVGEKP